MVETILGTSKLSVKCQVTIPKDAGKILGVKEVDRMVFINDDGKLVIRKARFKFDLAMCFL